MASLSELRMNSWFSIFAAFGLIFIFFLAMTLLLSAACLIFVIPIAILIMVFQWGISTSVVEWSTKIKYLKPGENRFLEKHVAELCELAEVPMPKLGIVRDPSPNAFVFGRSQGDMRLGVHTGLLEQLNKDEIRAVLAHEIGHIKHKDAVTMTVLSVLPLLAYWGAHMIWFGGRSREGGAILAFAIVSLVIYILSQLVLLRLSRLREYVADSYAGNLTGNPRALASGLVKITYGLSLAPKEKPSGARSFYIADSASAMAEMKELKKRQNQFDLDDDGVMDDRELEMAMEKGAKGRGGMRELMSTHPATHKRIRALLDLDREMRKGSRKEKRRKSA